MPNWCDNSVCIRGNELEVKHFRSMLEEAERIGNKTKQWHTFCLFELHGYDKDTILNRTFPYIGGSITGIGDVSKVDDQFVLFFYLETRWSPMISGIRKLISNYISLSADVCAEEPGCEIYVNTDTTGKWFPVKWCLYDTDDGTEYFDSDKELLDYVKDNYNRDLDLVGKTELEFDYDTDNSVYIHMFVNE